MAGWYISLRHGVLHELWKEFVMRPTCVTDNLVMPVNLVSLMGPSSSLLEDMLA